MTAKGVLITAAILGAISVGIGAFGAHGLKDMLTANGRLETFETAVKYQFYHTLALFLLGLLMLNFQHAYLNYAAYAFLAGITVFSGSLYVLCLTNMKWLGAITPLGGLGLIAGWVLLALAVYKEL